ncbi:MAG: hypothetical protein RLN87_09430 [Parasphingopyxis sp.]|uniref:DUF7064 domain-containing protein n=1 Tax=Parasphingopyxis sp. TaxID=1920299 RepID=UPI0032F0813C
MNEWSDFHRPAFRDWRWLETSWFGFFVPEVNMRGHLRAAFRTNQEVVFSMVNIYSRGGGVLDMDFFDSQMHVPLGLARYSNFSLQSGLSYRGHPAPDHYTVEYRSRCGRVALSLEYDALMPPAGLDITTLEGGEGGFAAFHRPSKQNAPTGHIDQTFKVVGELVLDGDRYDVNCVSNHDQSWSPRSEFNSMCGTFDNFHWGEEMTFSAQAVEQPFGSPRVTHAFLLMGNEVRKIRSADVSYERNGFETTRIRYDVVDETGEEHQISAEVLHTLTQDQGSNGITAMGYCIPENRGRKGMGETMWHWDIPEMQRIVREARKGDPDASIVDIFDDVRAR